MTSRLRLLAALTLLSVPATLPAQGTSAQVGDVNLDFTIGAIDAQAVLAAVVGLRLPENAFPRPWGDANCDNVLGAVDAAIILARTVALPTPGLCIGELRARVVEVRVTPSVPAAANGASVQLTATLIDSLGGTIANRPIVWTSADAARATVSQTGNVTMLVNGPADIRASAEGITATVTVNGPANTATGLRLVSGDSQFADPNTLLPQPLTVQVLDRGNNPLAGVEVRFTPQGNDEVSPPSGLDTTDVNGIASVRWVVRVPDDTRRITASVPDLDPVTFAARTGKPIEFASGCALASTNRAHCWGLNSRGQVGDATTIARATPVAVASVTVGPAPLSFSWLAPNMPGDHMCGVSSGTAYCWGANSNGQLGDNSTIDRSRPTAVALPQVAKVDVGVYHTCALTLAGDAFCWGLNSSGQLGTGDDLQRQAPAPVLGGLTFSDISVGLAHTCALETTGAVYCWGNNGSGQLGTGDRIGTAGPVRVAGPTTFQQISAGAFSTCALGNGDGTAFCWGANANGQLGDGTNTPRLTPQQVSGATRYASIRAQYFNACGRATDNTVWCWGAASGVPDGQPSGGQRVVPTQIAGGAVYSSLHVGVAHACARLLTGAPYGVPYCWGFGASEAFGDNGRSSTGSTPTSRRQPVPVQWVENAAPGTVAQIQIVPGSPSAEQGTALPLPPGVFVRDATGAALNGVTVTFSILQGGGSLGGTTPVTADSGFARLGSWTVGSVGTNMIGVTAGNAPRAQHAITGHTAPASLTLDAGDPDRTVMALEPMRSVTVTVRDASNNPVVGGAVRATALGTTGMSSGRGRLLGINPTTGVVTSDTTVVVLTGADGTARVVWQAANVPGTPQSLSVTAGSQTQNLTMPDPIFTWSYTDRFHCALGDSRAAFCWGNNDFGQLGDNSTTQRPVPVVVSGINRFSFLAPTSPGSFTCGIAEADSRVYCWGMNSIGQLGDGTLTNRSTPTVINGAGTYTQVATGTYFACGLRTTGSTTCWGANHFGQLGIGVFGGNRTSPNDVTAQPTAFASITAGSKHACGLTATGEAYCWGRNTFGQLGNGTFTDAASPVRVAAGVPFRSIVGGAEFTCALDAQGIAYCWGSGLSGELGNGTTTTRTLPTPVQQGGLRFVSLSANARSVATFGRGSACGLTSTGSAYCWGANLSGQLGNGMQAATQLGLTKVSGDLPFVRIAMKETSACGFVASGQPYCWGWGSQGQLGDGQGRDSFTPVAVRWPDGSPGAVASMIVAQGNDQRAAPSTTVPIPPGVFLLDNNGRPVSGAQVVFSVDSGGGSLTGGTATSDATGFAAVGSWTLGSILGANTLVARTAGVGTVKIRATAAQTSEMVADALLTLESGIYSWVHAYSGMDATGPLSTMARSYSASWNNFSLFFYSSVDNPNDPPANWNRSTRAWGNQASLVDVNGVGDYNVALSFEGGTDSFGIEAGGYVGALADANAVLVAIRKQGLVINNATDTKRAETMAALIQGASLMGLALNYDKALISDENTVAPPGYSNRKAIRDAALAKLADARALALSGAFTTQSSWFNGVSYTNTQIAAIASTMSAMTLAYYPRNATEAAAVDWSAVASHASLGIGSGDTFGFVGDGCSAWCPEFLSWFNDISTARVHTRVATLLDPATQANPWAGGNGQPSSADLRLGDGSFGNASTVTTYGTVLRTASGGSDFAWSSQAVFNPARGQYHQSNIAHVRYDVTGTQDITGILGGFGNTPLISGGINTLLLAEARLRTGDLAGAAASINVTRVGRGGLPAASASAGAGADTDGPCNAAGTLARDLTTSCSLYAMLLYEKELELLGLGAAPYYEQRKLPIVSGVGGVVSGLLPGTPREMPVPGRALLRRGESIYTWGGANAANSPTPP